jgi:hypothetical protein
MESGTKSHIIVTNSPYRHLSGVFLVDAVTYCIIWLADSLTWGVEFM